MGNTHSCCDQFTIYNLQPANTQAHTQSDRDRGANRERARQHIKRTYSLQQEEAVCYELVWGATQSQQKQSESAAECGRAEKPQRARERALL